MEWTQKKGTKIKWVIKVKVKNETEKGVPERKKREEGVQKKRLQKGEVGSVRMLLVKEQKGR